MLSWELCSTSSPAAAGRSRPGALLPACSSLHGDPHLRERPYLGSGYRTQLYHFSDEEIQLVMTPLEGGNRAELLYHRFCLCHKAACVSSASSSAPVPFIPWFYSPLGRWTAMEGMFFGWWSRLFQIQQKKEAFKAASTFFCRGEPVHVSEQLQSGSEQLPVHVRGPLRFSAASNLPFMLKTAF